MYFKKKLDEVNLIKEEQYKNSELLATYVEIAEINDLMSNFEETIIYANIQVNINAYAYIKNIYLVISYIFIIEWQI